MDYTAGGLAPCLHYVCNEMIFGCMEMKTAKACFGRDLRGVSFKLVVLTCRNLFVNQAKRST